jgi:hypothetical protein
MKERYLGNLQREPPRKVVFQSQRVEYGCARPRPLAANSAKLINQTLVIFYLSTRAVLHNHPLRLISTYSTTSNTLRTLPSICRD